MNAIISGVAEYGFYAQAEDFPVEGLVHISTLPGDYYFFDEPSHSLIGQRTKRQFRLGDKLRVTVVRIDLAKRQMDLRVAVAEGDATQTLEKPRNRKKHR
jgi:ribonuclease R